MRCPLLHEVGPKGVVIDIGSGVDLEAEFTRPAGAGDEDLLPADERASRGEVGEWLG